jgi:predicted transcriptional regulator
MKFNIPQNIHHCDDVIRCVFNFNSLDMATYTTLKKIGESRADKLARLMKRERSTIYRSLQKLTRCGICTKQTKTLPQGGYFHTYTFNDTQDIKKRVAQCIESWYTQMQEILNQFE